MRIAVGPPAVIVLASLAAGAAAGAFAVPASAQTSTAPPDACEEPLDRGERESYRFEDGRCTWDPGRVGGG